MTSQTKDDRKALIREYKQTPKEMGIYLIRNTANQKCYVASSRDITARFNRHRMELRTNSERAPGLQQDWNQFGEAAFEFEKLDVLEPSKQADYNPTEDLQVLEDLWLEKLQPFAERGYNKKPV